MLYKSQIPLRYLVADRFEAGRRYVRNWSATSFEPAEHVEIARICLKLVADRSEAKFHYAVWSQRGL